MAHATVLYRQWYGAERKEVDGVEQLWSLREEQAEDPDSPLLFVQHHTTDDKEQWHVP